MRSLFKISDDLQALDELLDSVGGEISDPQVEAAIIGWLHELETDQATKLDSWVNWLRTIEMEKVAAEAERDQYAAMAQTRENRIRWLKQTMKLHLESRGQTKATTATGRVLRIQANGGKVPVILADTATPESVPAEYVRVTYSIDGDAVRAALEAGAALDFAQFGTVGSHLRIR
jgi:hypothetical protein